MKQKVFRPTLDDVERLSLGKGARKRGTGSRDIPHRLNQDERALYDEAKDNNYLIIKGTAYRRERKGSPLYNTFRQRCDSLGQICIVVEKYGAGDTLKIDFSTLRVEDDRAHIMQILDLLKKKYPDVIDNLTNNCTDKAIDLNAVRNNPIWNIEPRLLTVHCIIDRLMAKSISEVILRESFVESATEETEMNTLCCDETTEARLPQKVANECHEIDWDDI